tara:strand:+ start:67 stop:345 length:279 start_codon:yes stop_codon:yes gene_type:complete
MSPITKKKCIALYNKIFDAFESQKQKINLINALSFWVLQEIEQVNNMNYFTSLEKKTNIKILVNVVKSSKEYTNKQIKELIKEYKYKYQLPF